MKVTKKISEKKIIHLYCPLFLVLYNLAGNLSNDIYLPSLPGIAHYFNISNYLIQMTMTAWFLGVALPQILFGLFVERYGCRLLVLSGGFLFLIATLICSFSISIIMLMIGRFFQGVAVASLNVSTFSTAKSHYYDKHASMKFLSYLVLIGSFAPILGPILGGYIENYLGWRYSFIVLFLFGSLIVYGLYHFMLESYHIKYKQYFFKLSRNKIIQLYKPIFKVKAWICIMCYTCLLAALIAYLNTSPFIIIDLFKIPVKYYGLVQLFPFSFFVLGSLYIIFYIKKGVLNSIMNSAFCSIATGLILLDFLSLIFYSHDLLAYLISIGFFLLGFSIVSGPLIALAMHTMSNGGPAAAVLGTSAAMMAALSSFIVGLFFHGELYQAIVIINIFTFLSLLTYIYIKLKVL